MENRATVTATEEEVTRMNTEEAYISFKVFTYLKICTK